MQLSRTRALAGLLALASNLAAPAIAGEFPLKDGDTWVMAGDSITAQHLHSNYFEAFCYARYPNKTFRFRNSGVGGDTTTKVLARFDYDVAAWKPTVVSVELGMNDQHGPNLAKYIANMGELDAKIRALGARSVYFSPSPINNGDTSAKIVGNHNLDTLTKSLKAFAAEKGAPFADQFHALLDPWGKNRPQELLATSLPNLKAASAHDEVAGVNHLRAFLDAQEKSDRKSVVIAGDTIHPAPTGQLMMAAALFKGLGGEEYVSLAALDAGGKVVKADRCTVADAKGGGGKIAFDRTDETIPFPIPEAARPGLALDQTVLHLSQFILSVEGLKAERYNLRIDGKDAGILPASTLRVGQNLTELDKGPLAEQGREVLKAIDQKEELVGQFRKQAKGGDLAKLDRFRKEIDAADARIREAAAPRKHHYELTPAG